MNGIFLYLTTFLLAVFFVYLSLMLLPLIVCSLARLLARSSARVLCLFVFLFLFCFCFLARVCAMACATSVGRSSVRPLARVLVRFFLFLVCVSGGRGGVAHEQGGQRPSLQNQWPADIKSLLKSGWQTDPDNRPSFREIHAVSLPNSLTHTFFLFSITYT